VTQGDRDAQPRGTTNPAADLVSDRILTLPNVLSALRLVGVPIFLWLLFSHHDVWAFAVLAASGISDYLDGKIARRFGLVSRLGQLLDPLADRLYVLSTLIALTIREVIPLWLLAVLIVRDLFMGVVIILLKRVGQTGLPVHFVGKAATFNLLYAFPILLLSTLDNPLGAVARPIGWGFAWWGTALYWLAAVLYAVQAVPILRAGPRPVGYHEAAG
jgi:cardiolipin synthase (CMP-forming)